MALPKRSSPTALQNASTRDLKQRVITNLNKLSDRDTHAIATTELESIARNLSHDSFSSFLTCIYDTDSSEKTPVRKQCVRLLGFLSEIHGDDLSPFLSKMLSNVVRRLRDPDTVVRSACVHAVTAMAAQITKPPFSVFLRSLSDVILIEQDYNLQIGSTLCLASAIEASPDPEMAQLQRILPRLVKLLRSDSFKAKPALLSLIGAIVGAGGASSHNVLGNLVPCMVEFLSSEDWAARKAAAEAFTRLAIVERDLLSDFKSSCLAFLEARRFDKVKVVRDTMNQMMEAWKEVPNVSDEASPPLHSKTSPRENTSDGHFPSVSGASSYESPPAREKTSPSSRSPSSDSSSATIASKRSPVKGTDRKPSPAPFRKLDRKKPTDWKVEIAVPHAPSFTVICEDGIEGRNERVQETEENERNRDPKPDTRRAFFKKNSDDKMYRFGGLRAGSRVVPFHEESSDSTVVVSNGNDVVSGNHSDSEGLSLIQQQLVQIENQQSTLLDLLQRFMGSSQNGIRSLETRVQSLEMVLDEIMYDMGMPTGRMASTDSAGNTCCKLPGAEFLSSKFWRKTEGRYSTSRFSSSGASPSLASMHNMADKIGSLEPFKLENVNRFHRPDVFVNPLADTGSDSRISSEICSNRMPSNIIQDAEGRQARNGCRIDLASHGARMSSAEIINRSTA